MKFQKPDVPKCQNVFNKIDQNNSGEIENMELVEGMKLLGIEMSTNQILEVLKVVDSDMDNKMDIIEFTHFVYIVKNAKPEEIDKILFLSCDSDFSGTIDKKEMINICAKLCLGIERKKICELVDAMSDVEDGSVSYDAFISFFSNL
ncbi:EF_hand domain-containing protein [Hexamita inflata]|uniref:EF_hand domain-containing protein n=1 Tax=Hexamita inflata TaxID=28002 RepID=A0ABP1KFD5_9EUKA